MKRAIGILLISAFVGVGAFAQTGPDLKKLATSFDSFAGDVASSLPYASTMGLNWSWAYIGKLPHFGVGLSAGAITLPSQGFDQAAAAVGMPGVSALLPELSNANLGLPLPAYAVEARLGGIIAPFDIGIKVGLIPPDAKSQISSLLGGMNVDFHLYGAELRYELVKEKFLLPEVSVGVGINHFDGTIGMPIGQSLDFPAITTPQGTYTVSMTQPELHFDWNSNSLDANIQVSKKILFLITPYIGAGLSYGISSAGGGVSSQLQINGSNATQAQLTSLETALAAAGQTANFSATDFAFSSKANGLSARAFGGVSLNILFIKVDATAMYNVMTSKLGATVGARIQF